jgi:hypothetical protein
LNPIAPTFFESSVRKSNYDKYPFVAVPDAGQAGVQGLVCKAGTRLRRGYSKPLLGKTKVKPSLWSSATLVWMKRECWQN